VGDKLGSGGMGSVYEVFKPGQSERLAMKLMLSEVASKEEYRKRFQREASVMETLHHPNILHVHATGEENAVLYIVMDLIKGNSLSDMLRRQRFSPRDTSLILNQIAQALDYAHDMGVLHRDVKPGNILIAYRHQDEQPYAHAYLVDFGLAKALNSISLTGTHVSLGTPEYMPPEQVLAQTITAQSDIYALGIVIYRMLVGQLPFHAKRADLVAQMQIEKNPPALSSLRPDFPTALEEVVLRALEKKPEKRYQVAGEFSAAFAHALELLSPAARDQDFWAAPQPVTS